jgi:hypothetical protein
VIVMSACITAESALVLGARFLRSSGRRDALADALEFEAIAHPRFGNEEWRLEGSGSDAGSAAAPDDDCAPGPPQQQSPLSPFQLSTPSLAATAAITSAAAGSAPPPAEQRVQEQPHQQCDREVGADLVLLCIADRRGRAEPFADTALCPREQRLCPQVYQSGERDLRGPLTKQGPRYLRWGLVEAATHACTAPVYRHHYQQTKTRIGKQRGAKVAEIDLARRLTEAKTMVTRARV